MNLDYAAGTKEMTDTMNTSGNEPKCMRNELKKIMRGYKTINRSIRKGLESLGFTVILGKTHCKVYFGNNFHNSYTIAKTPSDYRAGMNAVAGLFSLAVAV